MALFIQTHSLMIRMTSGSCLTFCFKFPIEKMYQSICKPTWVLTRGANLGSQHRWALPCQVEGKWAPRERQQRAQFFHKRFFTLQNSLHNAIEQGIPASKIQLNFCILDFCRKFPIQPHQYLISSYQQHHKIDLTVCCL